MRFTFSMATENTPKPTSHLKNKDWESGTAWLGTNLPLLSRTGEVKVQVSGASCSHTWSYDFSDMHTLHCHSIMPTSLPVILLHFYFNTNSILTNKPWVNIPPGQMPKQTSILSLLSKVRSIYKGFFPSQFFLLFLHPHHLMFFLMPYPLMGFLSPAPILFTSHTAPAP